MCKKLCWLVGVFIFMGMLVLLTSQETFGACTTIERTEIISVSTAGVQGDLGSEWADMTPDGRYVVFQSYARNLVDGDTNGKLDIFRHDRVIGETIRISIASDGTQADGDSSLPSISDNGRYIVFQSYAENLISNDINREWPDIYMRDVVNGTTELISLDSDENQKWGGASDPHISGDGNHVAFEYWSEFNQELDPNDTNDTTDIYVRDRTAGTTTLVSVATDGTQGDTYSVHPKISTDGRYIAFDSTASTFAAGDALNTWDVFVHDRTTGTTTIASVSSNGVIGNGVSSQVDISGDGRYTYFSSSATNLVPNTNGGEYLYDLITGKTISIGEGQSGAISANGRYIVTFKLLENEPGQYGIRIYDREAGTSWPVSISNYAEIENGSSYGFTISDDGRSLSFLSSSDNLILNDQNGTIPDIYVTDPMWYLELTNHVYLPIITKQ
jgi:hypothetical protein